MACGGLNRIPKSSKKIKLYSPIETSSLALKQTLSLTMALKLEAEISPAAVAALKVTTLLGNDKSEAISVTNTLLSTFYEFYCYDNDH